MTLKSRAVRSLNVILCSNQLSLKASACPPSLGLCELWSCILMSPASFNFAKKLHFRFTALSRAVVNLSVVSAWWSEVKVSSSVSQGLDQMTSWGVFQPALFHDSAVRRDACSTRAVKIMLDFGPRSLESGEGEGAEVYWILCRCGWPALGGLSSEPA